MMYSTEALIELGNLVQDWNDFELSSWKLGILIDNWKEKYAKDNYTTRIPPLPTDSLEGFIEDITGFIKNWFDDYRELEKIMENGLIVKSEVCLLDSLVRVLGPTPTQVLADWLSINGYTICPSEEGSDLGVDLASPEGEAAMLGQGE